MTAGQQTLHEFFALDDKLLGPAGKIGIFQAPIGFQSRIVESR